MFHLGLVYGVLFKFLLFHCKGCQRGTTIAKIGSLQMVGQISASRYLGALCMVLVKDKLFIEHNIFNQVCFTLLRSKVGVAPQFVLVCGAGMCAK